MRPPEVKHRAQASLCARQVRLDAFEGRAGRGGGGAEEGAEGGEGADRDGGEGEHDFHVGLAEGRGVGGCVVWLAGFTLEETGGERNGPTDERRCRVGVEWMN